MGFFFESQHFIMFKVENVFVLFKWPLYFFSSFSLGIWIVSNGKQQCIFFFCNIFNFNDISRKCKKKKKKKKKKKSFTTFTQSKQIHPQAQVRKCKCTVQYNANTRTTMYKHWSRNKVVSVSLSMSSNMCKMYPKSKNSTACQKR